MRRTLRMEGDCLVVPLADKYLDVIVEAGQLNFGITVEICQLVEKDDLEEDEYELKSISIVRPETEIRIKDLEVEEIVCQIWELEDGSRRKVVNWNMEEMDYIDIAFVLKQEDEK